MYKKQSSNYSSSSRNKKVGSDFKDSRSNNKVANSRESRESDKYFLRDKYLDKKNSGRDDSFRDTKFFDYKSSSSNKESKNDNTNHKFAYNDKYKKNKYIEGKSRNNSEGNYDSKDENKFAGYRERGRFAGNYAKGRSIDVEKGSRFIGGSNRNFIDKGMFYKKKSKSETRVHSEERRSPSAGIRLNKFISNSGLCARRAADELIIAGRIVVNGVVCKTLGYKVQRDDKVSHCGTQLSPEKKVYFLMNKPKGFITTMDDPEGRDTVMKLIRKACEQRIYPVGRLDCDTTGVLLFTNDGELSKKLSHPSTNIKKVYDVTLNKDLKDNDVETILRGITFHDGVSQVDELYVNPNNRKSVGIEIHSGKNRIVRRIFEHLGYEVVKLDRTLYGSLTKIGVERGEWRELKEVEVMELRKLIKR